MNVDEDFATFLKLLNDHDVAYLVVGGYAYAIHVEPRFTKDLDIFLKRDQENAQKILKVLEDFGFGSLDLSKEDFLEPDQVVQLGNPPLRIDLLTSISGVEFKEAWKNRFSGKYGEVDVFFIGKEELRKNKKATGRESDREDLRNMN